MTLASLTQFDPVALSLVDLAVAHYNGGCKLAHRTGIWVTRW